MPIEDEPQHVRDDISMLTARKVTDTV